MIRKVLALLMVILFGAFNANAQSSCDKLYATAVKYQQRMTVASQNQAISYFKKAKVCYDSAAKKKLCESQIATCNNTIALIKRKGQTNRVGAVKRKKNENVNIAGQMMNSVDSVAIDTIPVELSVSENVVKFKAKGGEFKKVKVKCNYSDWNVTEHPNWIDISINKDNEIVMEATKNLNKEERSGMVKIVCHDVNVSFAVIQAKKSLLNAIGM